MHLVVVNNIYPPIAAGGAELIVSWLSEELAARGHRVTVVSTCGPEMQPYPVEHRNGVTVIRFFPRNVYWNFSREGQPRHKRLLWHIHDAWNRDAGRRFEAILSETPPEIVHTHLIDGFSASVWRHARARGVPVIHTAHDYHLLCPRAFMLTRDWKLCRNPGLGCRTYRRWHLGTTRYLDLFASPSRFLLEQHRAAGLSAARTAVVRNGIPLPVDAAKVRQLRRPGKRLILLLCRLTVEKGVRVAIEAVANLPRSLDFELVVAGRGPLEPEVREAEQRDPRIRYTGYVTGQEKHALLASAHDLLIPSLWYENAPVAIIEASAYGLSVVGSRIGGIPEFVREGRTGLLFEPGDVLGLASAMSRLVTAEAGLDDLSKESWSLAQDYTVARMADEYLGWYERLAHLMREGSGGPAHSAEASLQPEEAA